MAKLQSSDAVFDNLTRSTYGCATSGAIGGFDLGGYESSSSSGKTEGSHQSCSTSWSTVL